MVPLIMPSASHATTTVLLVSHDQKSYVTPHFDCPDIENAHANAGTSGVTQLKKSCCTFFNHLILMKCIGATADVVSHMILSPVSMVSHD